MSSLQILFSAAGIPREGAAQRSIRNQHAKFSVRSKPRVALQPSASYTVDNTSSNSVRDVRRPPVASFKQCMWGDIFATFSFDEQLQQNYCEETESLVKEARIALMAANSTRLIVELVDTVERLGLAYHFESEIDEKLQHVYDSVQEEEEEDYDDLFTTALRFRLLRQHRYLVSANDALEKFVDKNKKLKEKICSDVEGMLSLYEAAHVRIHDEDILDEAVAFTSHHLRNMLPELESPMREKVQQALDYPLHKSLTILNLRFHISIYEKDGSRDELDLLRLAKLNFNFLQNMYRNELCQLSTWWNKCELKSKLGHCRDRLVECYLWGIAYHFEPQYSFVRMIIAKSYQIWATVDDTYDNYATLEEIQLFTQALERWNMDEIDVLPDYMKIIYKSVMSLSEDIEREAEQQEKSFVIPHYIDAVKQAGKGYCKEQEWIMERKMPSFEDYLILSRTIVLVYVAFIATIPGIKSATKETVDWLITEPYIASVASELGALVNDLASHQRESREGKMVTVMDCYMSEKGASKQEAISAYYEMIEDRWKHLNAEWVKSRSNYKAPKEMVSQFISIIQVAEVTYKNNQDGFTSQDNDLAQLIAALLLDPLLI